MLQSLFIRHLALVEQLSIEFPPGLIVISGETGAGKSLLLNALGLALGDRYNPAMLGNGHASGEVVAGFATPVEHPAYAWLQHNEFAPEETTLLRRTFTASGSRCYINGSPVTQSQASALGSLLIELHSQHEHHTLLQPKTQTSMYDDYCQHQQLVNTVAEQYGSIRKLTKDRQQLTSDAGTRDARDFVTFQLNELVEVAPEQGEYQKLSEQQKQHATYHQIVEFFQKAMYFLDGTDNDGAVTTAARLQQQLEALAIADYANLKTVFEQLTIQLTEAREQLEDLQPELLDEVQIQAIDQRLARLHEIARKHQIDPAQLPELITSFRKKLEQLEAGEDMLAELDARIATLQQQFAQSCSQLTASREEHSQAFSEAVTRIVQALAMPEAQFQLQFEPVAQANALGAERVRYLVQTNRGSKAQPLELIASGGELSRISLAIYQTCHASMDESRTMVFDEIDSGVSGEVAARIAELLKALGQRSQVICISHQPHVVASAQSHFLATKKRDGDSTYSNLEQQDSEQTITEIARMLGTEGTLEQSYQLAKQMYQIRQA